MCRVCIKVYDNGEIVEINNFAYLADTEGWIEIDEGEGDRYTHAQNNYLDGQLMTDEGIYRYRYADGEIVAKTDEELQAEIDALPTPPMGDHEVLAMVVNAASDRLTDEQITKLPTALIVAWSPDWLGLRGQVVTDEGQYYRSLHDVTNPAQNTKPSDTPSMWARVANPEDEWPEWVPYGGDNDNLPMTGAKVSHMGKRWISEVDNNVWEPGVYGWREVET